MNLFLTAHSWCQDGEITRAEFIIAFGMDEREREKARIDNGAENMSHEPPMSSAESAVRAKQELLQRR
jgi:hypothetical protein